jgi:hypothetical protein
MRRIGIPRVKNTPQTRREGTADRLGGGRCVTGETKEMGAFSGLELESTGDGCQHLGRNPNIAALLEPGIPGQADTGEVSDFLPTEARGAAAAAIREAHRYRRDSRTPILQKLTELCLAGSNSTRIT